MRTNSDYFLREIAGESMLIPTGLASQQLNGMIHLTETAAFIWKQVDTAQDITEIITNVTDEFEIDEDTAKRDVYGFLGELYKREMVVEIPELEQELGEEIE